MEKDEGGAGGEEKNLSSKGFFFSPCNYNTASQKKGDLNGPLDKSSSLLEVFNNSFDDFVCCIGGAGVYAGLNFVAAAFKTFGHGNIAGLGLCQ